MMTKETSRVVGSWIFSIGTLGAFKKGKNKKEKNDSEMDNWETLSEKLVVRINAAPFLIYPN